MLHISKDDLQDFEASLKAFGGRIPRGVVKCLRAGHARRGQLSLRILYITGLDRFQDGDELLIATAPGKSVRCLSTVLSHCDPDPNNWFTVMFAEPHNCTVEDLQDVYLVSTDILATGTEAVSEV